MSCFATPFFSIITIFIFLSLPLLSDVDECDMYVWIDVLLMMTLGSMERNRGRLLSTCVPGGMDEVLYSEAALLHAIRRLKPIK